jgi:hypothetical protein
MLKTERVIQLARFLKYRLGMGFCQQAFGFGFTKTAIDRNAQCRAYSNPTANWPFGLNRKRRIHST